MIDIICPVCNKKLLPSYLSLQLYIRKSYSFTCSLGCTFSRLETSGNDISYMSFYIDHDNERYEVALDRDYFNISIYYKGTLKILYSNEIDRSHINELKSLHDRLFDYCSRFIKNIDLQ